ncbi:MAG TPA: peptidylprolyl isomerase [bacterium]|jgi:FKBP-type peptidyl-prolyl cis-trans isomerase 2|nr:peptidylprolyl isomerase [bacterium]HNT65644.1 peptidylprolyl isomerase [bacterium]HOX86133.1 peptidylprolyl isomerase [bacterium]HPG45653.1 peptidylprolyl isomerase [bacterium]HPM97568.1 peptidylprolyl isomerase [bacterium]
MQNAQTGDTVKVHYKGYFDDGEVFDSSEGREPLEFTLGQNQVIPGFETAVIGKSIDEQVQVRIPPQEAYGEQNKDLIFDIERSQFPADITPQVGLKLQVEAEDGRRHTFVVRAISDSAVQLDGNHPMAGKTLNFDITLIDINKE